MEIDKNIQAQIEEIINTAECPKHFECYKSNFEKMCRVKSFGTKSLFTCQDQAPQSCKMSLSYGNIFFCKCPLRVLVAKKLNK